MGSEWVCVYVCVRVWQASYAGWRQAPDPRISTMHREAKQLKLMDAQSIIQGVLKGCCVVLIRLIPVPHATA